MKVLIRAERSEERDRGWGRLCDRIAEFHTIDLENGNLFYNTFSPIKTYISYGDLLFLDSSIYLLGSDSDDLDGDDLDGDDDGSVMGMGRLQLSDQTWEPISSPSYKTAITTASVVLDGKIYNMGYPCLNPEAYDPLSDTWSDDVSSSVPQHILDEHISLPVLADTSNHRILVHLIGTDEHETDKLYAYYPARCSWQLLADNFYTWTIPDQVHSVAAFADNILYNVIHYYHPYLTAYGV